MADTNKKKSLTITKTLLAGLFFCFLMFRAVTWAADEVQQKQDKVDDLQKELQKVQDEKDQALQSKLVISSDISKINSNISVIEERLVQSENDLREVENDIIAKQDEIDQKKDVIGNILMSINQADLEVGLAMLDSNGGLEKYFSAVDSLSQLEDKLYQSVEEIKDQKTQLDQKRDEQQKVFEIHDDQKKTLEYEKSKKNVYLTQTQQTINEKNAEIGDIQSKIAKLRADLSRMLGKGYDAKDIEDAAKFASKATGVRKDFLMGMLVVESDLGRYTGGCDYKESRMSNYRKDLFKKICDDLKYDYKKQKVSCPPAGYSGTGGAMGVAQFMSDTWNGYKSSIAAATGHNPPDPWSLTDGVTAMALKLAKVSGVTSHKESAECNAAKLYLSGTTSSKYDWYCDKVLYWADNYEKLIGD